jgi:hypothetical protein
MRALLVTCLLLLAAPALAGTAVCEVDLESGNFDWIAPDGERLERVRLRNANALFERLAAALAAGETAEDLRAQIGSEIVAPVWPSISGADAWRIEPLEVRGLPGPLGSFGLLTLPDGRAALEEVAVSLEWPRPLRASRPRTVEDRGALLLSAPFAADVDPATDDPDTLRSALRGGARTVRLIPRNETDVTTLRRALEEVRPSLWWFRGEADALTGMQAAFGALPRVVVWTLPSRSVAGAPELSPMTLASSGEGPSCVIVATRAVSETALAPLARRLVDAIAIGLDCGTALHEAQLSVAGEDPVLAGSLIIVGDPLTTAGLDRAPWLRRLFH